VNTVSSSLIRQPNFKGPNDEVRLELVDMANQTAAYDPEFILKVC